jgi:drug/metabolite transporter (DMT)-like permease
MLIGAALVSVKFERHKGSSGIHFSQALLFVALGGFFSGVSAVLEKYLMNINIPAEVVFGYSRIGVAIPSVIIFFFVADEIRRLFRERKHHTFLFMFTSESITLLGTFLIFLAIAAGPIALVATVVTTEPLFVLLLASALGMFMPRFLVQEFNKEVIIQKVAAIFLIVFGMLLIS